MATRTLARRTFLAGLAAPAPPTGWFEQIPPARSGIAWTHDNAISPKRYLPESLGPGVAFIDYDNDGWPDIFLVNSGPCSFYQPKTKPRHALYRNNRDGTFSDVTRKAGLSGGTSFGMGAAAADFNNDGFADLLVTAYGKAALYRNNGNGTFTDITARSGIEFPSWTTSAVWFDYDGDGLLDLFVCGFVDYAESSQNDCIADRGGNPGYCIPRIFKAGACRLYRNNGDGTFKDVSVETGIAARASKALGVVATDVDNDGRLDLFVANDTLENFLWVANGKGFRDTGYAALVALGESGWARSGMGVDAADFNQDGHQDLIVANIDRERYSLYRNTGHGMFDDLSFAGEIGRATYDMSGWGLRFADFDNDGADELILANGHPDDKVAERSPRVKYREPLLLFAQRNGAFTNISAQGGPAFNVPLSARGLATGDYNNDGKLDVLIGDNGGAPVLLKNTVAAANNWIGVKLRGVKANRDGVGAMIKWSAGGITRQRLKRAGGSFMSSHDPREILGIGRAEKVDWIEVRWPAPSTRVDRFKPSAINRYITVEEGAV